VYAKLFTMSREKLQLNVVNIILETSRLGARWDEFQVASGHNIQ
jgi:hypothetical protein